MDKTSEIDDSLNALDGSVRRWQWGIIIYVVLTFVIYIFWFGIKLQSGFSEKADAWGQAGDFIGGMLNPVVALAAFFWLTKGVALQKRELADSRAALAGTRAAQERQAVYAADTVKLDALTALFNATTSELEMRRNELQFIVSQIGNGKGGVRDIRGEWIQTIQIENETFVLGRKIDVLTDLRDQYKNAMSEILQSAMLDAKKKGAP